MMMCSCIYGIYETSDDDFKKWEYEKQILLSAQPVHLMNKNKGK